MIVWVMIVILNHSDGYLKLEGFSSEKECKEAIALLQSEKSLHWHQRVKRAYCKPEGGNPS